VAVWKSDQSLRLSHSPSALPSGDVASGQSGLGPEPEPEPAGTVGPASLDLAVAVALPKPARFERTELAAHHMVARSGTEMADERWYRRLAGLGCMGSWMWSSRQAVGAQLAASESFGTG
jgi:hypothetical protein